MPYIDALFQFWIDSSWYVALSMSTGLNILVFVITAAVMDFAIDKLVVERKFGNYIDDAQLKHHQKRIERRNGIFACIIFAISSLLTRHLFDQLWPISFVELVIQVIVFTLFYESYSYFVHRLLHMRPFAKVHGVHHRSVRVTPWSAYSVHPVEAIFIGMSAPIFMSLFSLSLGVALVLHILGMMFTILIHSNYQLPVKNNLMKKMTNFPAYHLKHHITGKSNFGFVNSFWDRCFKTRENI